MTTEMKKFDNATRAVLLLNDAERALNQAVLLMRKISMANQYIAQAAIHVTKAKTQINTEEG